VDINKNIFYTVMMLIFAVSAWKFGDFISHLTRNISTNGLSERTVKSDSAVWAITIVNETDDIASANGKRAADKQELMDFLLKSGFETSSISEMSPQIDSNVKNDDTVKPAKKYTIHDKFVVRTDKVQLVEKSLNLAQLVDKGIEVRSTASYYYSGLDKLRVEMVDDAAADSQNRAKRIAETTGAKLLGLRHLNTGSISITADDASSANKNTCDGEHSAVKRIRVVVHGTFDIE
jgi:hypothetical protein